MANPCVQFMYIGLAILLFVNVEQLYGQKKYPDWFLFPQKYPKLITGFSFAGVTSVEEDAIWRFSYQQKGYLSGTASYFNHEDSWEKNYITEALVPLLNPSQIQVIAQFSTSPYLGGEEIALFRQVYDDSINYSDFHSELPSLDRPYWVKKAPFYAEGNKLYGVGQYVLKGNENDAWRMAEERALVEIASAVGIGIEGHSISKDYFSEGDQQISSNETSRIVTYKFQHEFSQASVLERWIDYANLSQDGYAKIYTLMGIQKDSIKQNMVNGK